MGWFLDSLSTILVVCVLIFSVGLAIRSIIKDRKKGDVPADVKDAVDVLPKVKGKVR